jgi:VWFA-related protein
MPLFARRSPALAPGLVAVSALAPLVLAATLDAQAPSLQKEVKTREVYVSAVDRRGAPVADLGPADFTVREDGAVREVLAARPADDPLQVAVLIDDSQAAMDATTYLREGLTAFLERLHGKGEVGLITTGERPTVLAPYSSETEELKQRVNRIFPRSGTGAYLGDAIMEASRALAKRQARRAVILAITFEGIDYSNRYHQQVLDELKKSGVALHVIAVGTPAESTSDEMRSRNLVIAEGTARTGGRRDQVLALSGLPDKLKQAADELTHQYVLSYNRPVTLIPPTKIEVGTTRRNVTVRARTWLGDS